MQCNLENLQELWVTHKPALTEDFLRTQPPKSEHMAEHRALQHIREILESNGESYTSYDLPEIVDDEDVSSEAEFHVAKEIAQSKLDALNQQQRSIVDSVLQALNEMRNGEHTRCRAYFLGGPGGSGKTTV